MSITLNDAQIRQLILPAFTGYSNDDYIARKVLPVINVNQSSGQVAVFTADSLRLINSATDGNTKAAEVNAGLGWSDFDTLDHFKSYFVSDRLAKNFSAPVEAGQAAAQFVAESLLVEEERALGLAMANGNFAAGHKADIVATSTAWDAAGGDPADDINTGLAAVRTATGKYPNTMIVTPDVHLVVMDFVRNAHSLAQYGGLPTSEQMAAFFGVDTYMVASAIYDSSVEGQAASLANAWGTENCWLIYTPKDPSSFSPSFGYTIDAGSSIDTDISKNPPGVNYLIHADYQSKILSYSAGYVCYNVLT